MTFPSLDLYRTFASVADTLSITAAARELMLSKATVSKQISELEHRLGVVLFARTTRNLSLTDAGHKAFARSRRIMDEAEALVEEAQESRASPRGRLRIAVPQTFARLWLAEALPDFIKQYPEIELDFSVDDRTVDLVAEGFDAAIRIGAMPDSSLLVRRLGQVHLLVVASPAYWQKHGRPSHPDDLSTHRCFRYSNTFDPSTWRFIDENGKDARVRVSGPLTINGGELELPALRAGLGVALLPDFILCEDVRKGNLEIVLPNWSPPELHLQFLTPPGRGKPKRLEVFTDYIITRFGGRISPWALP